MNEKKEQIYNTIHYTLALTIQKKISVIRCERSKAIWPMNSLSITADLILLF